MTLYEIAEARYNECYLSLIAGAFKSWEIEETDRNLILSVIKESYLQGFSDSYRYRDLFDILEIKEVTNDESF